MLNINKLRIFIVPALLRHDTRMCEIKNHMPQEEVVRLIWATPDGENLIAYIARVSNPSSQQESKNNVKLLQYLIRNHHWSPFEMVSMCVEINTTRAIAPQILRHRSFSFQEFSQRYADVGAISGEKKEGGPTVLPIDLRRQDIKNRQNSIDDVPETLSPEVIADIEVTNEAAFAACQRAYKKMLYHGIAKECARAVLPLQTPTRIYMSGTLRSWIHYVQLRSSNGTQKEHAAIARAIGELIKEVFPAVHGAVFG
jgi:thymidylate synthase (FAD)